MFVHVSSMLNGFSSIPSDLTFVHYGSGLEDHLWTFIRLAAALVIISTMAVVLYCRRKAFKALRSRSTLPIRNKPSELSLSGREASERQQRQWSI